MTHYSAIGLSIVFVSCSALDPDYAEYKKLKEAQAAQSPYGQVDDFGIPGAGTEGAPYQPLPNVLNTPPAPIPTFPGAAPAPIPAFPDTVPGANTVPHNVAKGDSLWGLAKRYNTTVEAIQAANGISGTNIQAGQTLQIPNNN